MFALHIQCKSIILVTVVILSITREHTFTLSPSECLFLRYGPAMRRCPMPSPITITTIKNLFVNMFDLSPSVLENKTLWQVFILDRANSWRPLEKAR